MFSLITKIWIFLLVAVVLALSLLFSAVLFVSALVIMAISIPYIFYIKWKAEKEMKKMEKDWIEVDYESNPEKKLQDKF